MAQRLMPNAKRQSIMPNAQNFRTPYLSQTEMQALLFSGLSILAL
jgi:hypothetical protein